MRTPQNPSLLDHSTWNALASHHASLAVGNEWAKRYPYEISPLAAVKDQSATAYAALRELLTAGETAVQFLQHEPDTPEGFERVAIIPMEQMIRVAALDAPEEAVVPLGVDDIPEMLALTNLTEPGPFRHRTIEFGGYLGIRDAGKLVAMAGQRLSMPGFTEISAVCTHPAYRGRGYAHTLVSAVARGIHSRGEMPVLGVRSNNVGAIRVYQRAGFAIRQRQYVVVLKKI